MLQAVVIWIHVVAAMFWIGGMLFFALVVVPALQQQVKADEKTEIISRIGKRFRIAGWGALGILFASGVLRLYQNRLPLGSYGAPFRAKLLLVVVMVLLALLHDFVLGPKSIAMRRTGSAPRIFSSGVRWLARLNLIIGLLIVFAAVLLVHRF